jgi:hypothetical protein
VADLALGRTPSHFFLRDTLLSSGTVPTRVKIEGDWIFPYHLAFCCGYCGEIWGRVVYGEVGGRHWQFISRPCERHADQWQARTAGSLVLLDRDVGDLPEAVVRYEFELMLRKFEKGTLE